MCLRGLPMDQIILNLNLKYIIAPLSMQQKAQLFDALFLMDNLENSSPDDFASKFDYLAQDLTLLNLIKYIFLLQKDVWAKKNRMKTIGAKGGAAHKKINLDCETPMLFDLAYQKLSSEDKSVETVSSYHATDDVQSPLTDYAIGDNQLDFDINSSSQYQANAQSLTEEPKQISSDETSSSLNPLCLTDAKTSLLTKRKVAKEKVLNNINNNFISASSLNGQKKNKIKASFQPPSVADVRDFVVAQNLNVDPDTFVDFYEARDWCVGKTAIKNWKPIAKLWHRRTLDKNNASSSFVSAGKNQNAKILDVDDEENYWSQLKLNVQQIQDKQSISPSLDNSSNSVALLSEASPLLPLSNLGVGKFDSDTLSSPESNNATLVDREEVLCADTLETFASRCPDADALP